MRVLVTSIPGAGHVLPLVPLVEAMLAAGDEVVAALHPSVAAPIASTGCRVVATGHDEGAWFERLRARTRGGPGDGIRPERINHYFFPRVFAEIGADDMIDDVLAAARELDPDVVVFETYALAGPLVAELTGALGVQHCVGPVMDPGILELGDDAVSPLWRRHGRSTPGFAGVYAGATVTICPPTLEAFEVPSGRHLQVRPAPLPTRPHEATSRPLLYVTLGTFFAGNLEVFEEILDAVADLPVDVVVTLGRDADPSALRAPGNTVVEQFVPQGELLPRCAAVIHHGGGGTTFGALAHGLPQVVLAQGADNYVNAAMLASAGAGIGLDEGSRTARDVRAAVSELLEDPAYAAAARGLAQQIAAMPSPGDVASSLRELAASTSAR